MATCGEYELEKAIGWGRRSTLFSARISGASGPASIVIRRARTVERTLCHAFLRAAAEQQTAVGAGCRRLAPILSFACDDTGFAYYATARYETSLAEFLEAGCKVDSALLLAIVTGVLVALTELHDKSRRAHGNLTPGNILLDPQGHIFLTDLAPSAKDATTADDLFALGALIYQLVRRTARVGSLNPPLDYSPAWTESLGDDAEGWRAFTNRVLTKSRYQGPEPLKLAAEDLKSRERIKKTDAPATTGTGTGSKTEAGPLPPKKRSPLPKLIAIILLLAGGGGGFVWYKNDKARQAREKEERLEIERINKIKEAQPPAIKNLRTDLAKPLPKAITDDKTLNSLLGLRIKKSLDGGGGKTEVMSLLGNWDLPGKLKAQAATWKSATREWTSLARELDATASIDPDSETSVIAQLEKAIAARENANELDRVWEDVTLTLKDLKATNNPLLPDFTPWVGNEILNAKNLADAPVRMQKARDKLTEVLSFQRDPEMGARVLWPRFEKEAPKVREMPSIELMPDWPDRWKQEAARFIGPSDAKLKDLKKIFANLQARINLPGVRDKATRQKALDDVISATDGALDSDVAAIEKRLKFFDDMTTPAEDDFNNYVAFLKPWLKAWSDLPPEAKTRGAATAAIDKFKKGTADPKVAARYKTASFANQLGEALKVKDRITPNAPGWTEVPQPAGFDPNAMVLKFAKGEESFVMPFLGLDKEFAMAAWETPLKLARLSGAPANRTGDGPQIRRTNTFLPAPDWLWKGPTDLKSQVGAYFAPGVVAGDVGSDYCPTTWLTFSDASGIAEKLGGRLPKASEWKIASGKAGKERRLRSAGAWGNQYPLLKRWQEQTTNPQGGNSPDSASFSKSAGLLGNGNNAYLTDSSPAQGATPDGKLWLAMGPDPTWKPANGFTHLIGNAAEWVNDNNTAAVIGGSVVSPPSLPTDRPIPVTERGGSYFDVTFRLVIPLGAGGANAWLAKFEETIGTIRVPDKADSQ